MVYEHDALIASYEHLADRPRAAEALQTLRRVSTMVKPLMRARGWRVGVLCEFFPDQTNLLGLNWNRGARICLRLRHAADASQFLPFEQVLDTMLHELAHIKHGPHDAAFHALWDQLRDEHAALVRKGYTGEGFLSKGHRLGGRSGLSAEEAARQARRAARAREEATKAAGNGGGGRRLGGQRVRRDEDIRQVIADAAERRRTITGGCASGARDGERIAEEAARNGFRTQAEEDEANERAIMDAAIDLIREEEEEEKKKKEAKAKAGVDYEQRPVMPPPVPLATKPATGISGTASTLSTSGMSGSSTTSSADWTCDVCTLRNRAGHLCCDACGTERPSTLTAADYRDDSAQIELGRLAAEARRRGTAAMEDMGDCVEIESPGTRTSSAADSPHHHKRRRKRRVPADAMSTSTTTTTTSTNASSTTARRRPTADTTTLRPRSSATQLAQVYQPPADKPLGWRCRQCGSFMEREWWTCSLCGRMKESS